MATSLAAMSARRAATLARLSPSATRAASLVPRRGLAGAAGTELKQHHASPKDATDTFDKNMFAYAGLFFLVGFRTGMYLDEKDKEEKVVGRAK